MSKDLIIAILALAFAGCAGALLVTLAKLDEWKDRAAAEHANHVEAMRIGNTNAEYAQRLENEIAKLDSCLNTEIEYADGLIDENRAMQDHLSALLCPRNDHIWENDVCKRCGRTQCKS